MRLSLTLAVLELVLERRVNMVDGLFCVKIDANFCFHSIFSAVHSVS